MIHVHPFPARMAPEIALDGLRDHPRSFMVLDPMAGSGMVLGTAARLGMKSIGYDLDPLACMISKVSGTRIDEDSVRAACKTLLSRSRCVKSSSVVLPWIDEDEKTKTFVQYWFAPKQVDQLRRFSFFLVQRPFTTVESTLSILKVALSRLIVTKEPKASLARDTAHSRPHRTVKDNDFDIFSELAKSLEHVLLALSPSDILENVRAYRGDARKLGRIGSASIDCIVTSPPYLNAIDYMRGHKFSLVWFGYNLAGLRRLRARSVGAEISSFCRVPPEIAHFLANLHPDVSQRKRHILRRYYLDLISITTESYRVLKPLRRATYVVGNSSVRGHDVDNCYLLISAATRSGFQVIERSSRQIPNNKRYLPLLEAGENDLSRRMKTEHIVTFQKAA